MVCALTSCQSLAHRHNSRDCNVCLVSQLQRFSSYFTNLHWLCSITLICFCRGSTHVFTWCMITVRAFWGRHWERLSSLKPIGMLLCVKWIIAQATSSLMKTFLLASWQLCHEANKNFAAKARRRRRLQSSDHAKFLLGVRKFYVAAVEYIKANSLLQMKSLCI